MGSAYFPQMAPVRAIGYEIQGVEINPNVVSSRCGWSRRPLGVLSFKDFHGKLWTGNTENICTPKAEMHDWPVLARKCSIRAMPVFKTH